MDKSDKKYIKKIDGLNKFVAHICKKHRVYDPQNILHTLLSLEQTPIRRLEMSIRRANLPLYAKRD